MASQPPSTSAASRYLFMIALGALLGVVATVMVLRALQARRDPFPTALMQVMAAQAGRLDGLHAHNRCSAADALPRLQSLRALANDLEPAFPGLRDDSRFVQHAGGLRRALDQALAQPPGTCVALAQANARIDEACRACHQDFR